MKGVAYMMKQEDLNKALIQLVNVSYLINDGDHDLELMRVKVIVFNLLNELNDANRREFEVWLDKKMKEEKMKGNDSE